MRNHYGFGDCKNIVCEERSIALLSFIARDREFGIVFDVSKKQC